MATVTGYTAAHMDSIKNATIVSAAVVNSELIFTRYDTTTQNLGNVFNFDGSSHIVCTSSTRPSVPYVGMQIYETDTGNALVYYGATSGWMKEWDKGWGRVAVVERTTDVNIAVTATSLLTTSSITLRNDRIYEVSYSLPLFSLAAGAAMTLEFFFTETTTTRRVLGRKLQGQSDNNWFTGTFHYTPASTNTNDHRIRGLSSATGTVVNGTTAPGQLTITDIGPNGNPPSA